MKAAQDIILKPVITEESMAGMQDKKYTFKVRAYRLDGSKKVYGKFSAAKKIS